jgi:hypothetical protein
MQKSLFVLLLSTFCLLPVKAQALNQMSNWAFTGNSTGWTTVTNNGTALCGTNTRAATDVAWDASAYATNNYTMTLTNNNTSVAQRNYISQTFTVPGTGSQRVIANFSFTSNAGSYNAGANTSWTRIDVFDSSDTSFVGTFGCLSFNTQQATQSVGSGAGAYVTLTGGTTYTIAITGRTQNSAANTDIIFTYDDVLVTTPPVNVQASLDEDFKPVLTWDVSSAASGANGLHATTPYKVYRGTLPNTATFLANATTNSYTDTSTSDSTQYYYWVTNMDTASVESASSTEIAIETSVLPTVVTNLAGVVGVSSASISGRKTGGTAATGHGFAVSQDSAFRTGVSTSTLGALSSDTTFTLSTTTLAADTTYFFRAYASNTQGTAYGATRSFTTGNTSVTRHMRLFNGYKIKVVDGKLILDQR